MIPITRPFLPPKEKYIKYINDIYDRSWLTNNGPLVNNLEIKLKEYLGLDHMLYLTNGTIAIQLAIKALDLKGEIITTPFSYIATTSSIVWENCKPIFADVLPDTYNINPKLIEELITENTSAIIATHVYGNPCDIESIGLIAKKHKLKVIYDGAHAFGVKYKGKSIFEYGDISTTSFHATKLFHTVEGGAVFTKSSELLKKMAIMKNFGHYGSDRFVELGVNGKNSEFHAAMGLCNMEYIDEIIEKRKQIYQYYKKKLEGLNFRYQSIVSELDYNFSYFPILFESQDKLIKVQEALIKYEIFPRRYFYPTLNKAEYLTTKFDVPIAEDIANRVLCLPSYHTLTFEEIDMISRIISRTIKYP